MNCLRSLERWNRGFESDSRHGCLYCVQAASLRRDDPQSKKSYWLCMRLRNRKSGQGPTKGLWSHSYVTTLWVIQTLLLRMTGILKDLLHSGVWKAAVMVSFRIRRWNSTEGSKETRENVRIVGVPAGIRTGHFQILYKSETLSIEPSCSVPAINAFGNGFKSYITIRRALSNRTTGRSCPCASIFHYQQLITGFRCCMQQKM
jgi:hypothetical protein